MTNLWRARRALRNGLELLEPEDRLRLLAGRTFGRLALTVGALPVILPVSYRLIGDRIVFRTGIGTKLDAATCEPADLAEMAEAGIPRWAPAGGDRIVEIATTMVSGRRIVPGTCDPSPKERR